MLNSLNRNTDYSVELFIGFQRLMNRIAPMTGVMKFMGIGGLLGISSEDFNRLINEAEQTMHRCEIVFNSMTKAERRKLQTINGKRRQRIARGAGLSYSAASEILNHFDNMRFLKF